MSMRTSSGIPGLDELIEGGFPRGRVILLMGEPGAGKTIFANQFIVHGIQTYKESGVYVTLDETKLHLQSEMAKFNWDLKSLEEAGKLAFVDATPLRLLPEKVRLGEVAIDRKDFTMASLVQAINREVERIRAKRVAVDSLTSLIFQYPDTIQRRVALLDLIGALSATNATCMVTAELKSPGIKRNVEMEEFLAHGVVVLQTVRVGNAFTRVLQIEKMRETACDPEFRPYRISTSGLEVFPRETVFK